MNNIIKKYGMIYNNIENNIDCLYIDGNNKNIDFINYLINHIKPKKFVFIVYDGIIPMAKIKYKRMLQFNNKVKVINNYEFYKNNVEKNIIVSNDCEIGESKYKIINHINNNDNDNDNDNDNILIFSNECDIILSLLFIKNKLLYFINNDLFLFTKLAVLNIYQLKLKILNDLSIDKELTEDKENRYMQDFVLLTFFMGNNYLPNFEALKIKCGGFEELINNYVTINGFLINENNTINFNNLYELFNKLSERELTLLCYQKFMRNDNSDDDKIMVKNYGWKNRYYKYYDYDNDNENQNIIFQEYIKGIIWNYNYYKNNEVDWNWYYPYPNTLLIKDFCILLKNYEYDYDNDPKINNDIHNITKLEQMIMILHPNNFNLLGKEVVQKLKSNNMYNYYFPKSYKIYNYDNDDNDNNYYELSIPIIDRNVIKKFNIQ